MQAWHQVKVLAAGEYEGKAGLVVRVDSQAQVATVKLDEVAEPVGFAFSELQVL